VRVRVTTVLGKGFAIRDTDFLAARGRPASASVQVFIQSVLPTEPHPLTLVAGEHGQFFLKCRRDIDDETGRKWPAEVIDSLDRIT